MKRYSQEYWVLRLLNLRGVGNAKVRKILDLCRAGGFTVSEFIERAVRSAEKTNLLTSWHLDELTGENRGIDEQWEALCEADVKLLVCGAEQYPTEKMLPLNNRAPVLLFARGNLGLLGNLGVGFCGSRKASEKGLKTAWDIADQMAHKGVNIVSGYASGVDMTAHKTALEAGGSTIIVLAEGILNFRVKKTIAELFDESRILILSEFLPGLPWSVRNAMTRNSTICVLSDVMVLIEAEEKGGSITAGKTCLDMQRPLFAPVYSGMPESAIGNAILLRKGARELKKSRKTDRANLTAIEEILFKEFREEVPYARDFNQDLEQMTLFEDSAPYKKANKRVK